MRASPLLLIGLALLAACGTSRPPAVTVFAASSLTRVLEDAGARFQAGGGDPVVFRFEGSGRLAVEIQNGAPANIFVAAHPAWMQRLGDAGEVTGVRELARNRLVVAVPRGRPPPASVRDLAGLDRVAVGEPNAVPVGSYARQSLKQIGVWDSLTRRVEGPSARAVLALVERGDVDAGIVFATDALASDRVDVALRIPDDTHDPIVYELGLVSPATPATDAFIAFLFSPRGKTVFREHGFEVGE